MPAAHLPDRAVISVTGPDAEHLLQTVITTDLARLAENEAKPGALLTPQGKILFDFLVSRDGERGFALETRADVADELVRRLTLYRLRAKAEISKRPESLVSVFWQTESGPFESESATGPIRLRDLRFPEAAPAWRSYGPQPADGDPASWQSFRIGIGVPESGADYALGDAFPHDALLDQTDGVGFRKGCYVGQEVVSRMQHRGTARRRILLVTGSKDLPAAETPIVADGRELGRMGSSSAATGLALVRIDKVKAAMDAGQPITADGVDLSFAIPSWARFTFPEEPAAESA
jgi:folate-binding protein YgfZ